MTDCFIFYTIMSYTLPHFTNSPVWCSDKYCITIIYKGFQIIKSTGLCKSRRIVSALPCPAIIAGNCSMPVKILPKGTPSPASPNKANNQLTTSLLNWHNGGILPSDAVPLHGYHSATLDNITRKRICTVFLQLFLYII